MKNSVKRFIAFILLICTFGSTLLLSSCYNASIEHHFPEGYTGGLGIDDGSGNAAYWVETYEECMAAIELLKSNGSTIPAVIISSYEGDLFDIKYCISMNIRFSDKIKYGENPFDRYAYGVSVQSYAFYEDVTIEQINYSYVREYLCFRLNGTSEFINLCKSEGGFTRDSVGLIDYNAPNNMVIVYGTDSKTKLLSIDSGKNYTERIPQDGAVALLNSIVTIEE